MHCDVMISYDRYSGTAVHDTTKYMHVCTQQEEESERALPV